MLSLVAAVVVEVIRSAMYVAQYSAEVFICVYRSADRGISRFRRWLTCRRAVLGLVSSSCSMYCMVDTSRSAEQCLNALAVRMGAPDGGDYKATVQ